MRSWKKRKAKGKIEENVMKRKKMMLDRKRNKEREGEMRLRNINLGDERRN